jgi:hypothetical protein
MDVWQKGQKRTPPEVEDRMQMTWACGKKKTEHETRDRVLLLR